MSAKVVLTKNQFGKAENRVVRVYRDTDRHTIRDLNWGSPQVVDT